MLDKRCFWNVHRYIKLKILMWKNNQNQYWNSQSNNFSDANCVKRMAANSDTNSPTIFCWFLKIFETNSAFNRIHFCVYVFFFFQLVLTSNFGKIFQLIRAIWFLETPYYGEMLNKKQKHIMSTFCIRKRTFKNGDMSWLHIYIQFSSIAFILHKKIR